MKVSLKISELNFIDGQCLIDRPDLKEEFLIFKDKVGYRCISSFCPHFGGPLKVEKNRITCYFHSYCFDKKSLKCTNRKLSAPIKEYKIINTNDHLEIEFI